MKITTDRPLIVSPIVSFHAYLAAKMPHSWCGGGNPTLLQLDRTGRTVASQAKIEKEDGQEPLSDSPPRRIALQSLTWCGGGRAPPQYSNPIRELAEELEYDFG